MQRAHGRVRTWPYYAAGYPWPQSALYPVLRRERILRTKKDRENDDTVAFTHTMFNGGVLNVPQQDYIDRFLPLLETDYNNGCFWSISEKNDPLCFPMYMDLDSDEGLTKEIHQTLIDTYHKLLFQYYPQEDNIQTTICMKPDQEPSEGVHVITPSILLNIDRASHICEHLRIEMLNSFPDVNWIKIIDTAVYTNGLRMCYSYKCKDCPECADQVREYKTRREQYELAINSIDEHIEKKKAFYAKKKIDHIKNSHLINDFEIANPERLKAFPILPNPRGNGYVLHDNAHVIWNAIRTLKIEDLGPRPRQPACDTCTGEGRIFTPSEYIPLYQLHVARDTVENPTLVEFQGTVLQGLIMTSLRRDRNTDMITEPFNAIALPGFHSTAMANMRKRAYTEGRNTGEAGNKRGKRGDASNPLITIQDPQDERFGVIEAFLRTSGPQYRFVSVRRFTLATMASVEKQNEKRLQRLQKQAETLFDRISYNMRLPDYHMKVLSANELERVHRIFVEVTGIGCHYCHNKRAEHGKNTIKFELADNGECYQRCYSTKTPAQSTIPCNEFRHLVAYIPPDVMGVLFPAPTISVLNMNRRGRSNGKVSLLGGTVLTRQGTRARLALIKRYMDYVVDTTGAEIVRRNQSQPSSSQSGRRVAHFFDDEAEEADSRIGLDDDLSNLEI